MLILVSYDVSTESEGGKRRLRRIAKLCLDHGLRVQFSVFECHIDSTQLVHFRNSLLKEMDENYDSLRFYILGNRSSHRVEHYGQKASINLAEDTLCL